MADANIIKTSSVEYLAYVQAMTYDFGAYREGASKIKYYVNLL